MNCCLTDGQQCKQSSLILQGVTSETLTKHSGFKGQRAPFSGGWESEAERQGRRSVMQSQDEGLGYPTERGKINTPAGCISG